MIDLVLDFLYRAVRLFGAVLLAGIIGLTVYDVFMRFFFNDPVLGSNEMIQFLLGGMVFAGIAMVTFHRSHIVVSIFEPALLRLAPRLYKGLIASFNLVGILIVTYLVVRYTRFQFQMRTETETLDLKWGHLGIVFTVLCVIAIAFGIKSLWAPRPRPGIDAEHQGFE